MTLFFYGGGKGWIRFVTLVLAFSFFLFYNFGLFFVCTSFQSFWSLAMAMISSFSREVF